MSNDDIFITRSTVAAKEKTIEIDGVTYPLVNLKSRILHIGSLPENRNWWILQDVLISL